VVSQTVVANVVASLGVGRHLLLLGKSIGTTEALAEAIGDEAADSGLCCGALTMTAKPASLVSIRNVVVDHFRDDFWLILRQATPVALRRVIDDLAEEKRAPTWRFIAAATAKPRALLTELSPAARRQLALIEVE
jgi:hypothetical protein